MNEKPDRTNLEKELYKWLARLDDVETRAIQIMVNSMRDGETDAEATEKAADFLLLHGRNRQAQAMRDTAKTFAEGARI